MRLVYRFPVKNSVRVDQPWPVSRGCYSFCLERKEDLVTAVILTESGVPVSKATTIEKVKNNNPRVKAQVTDRSGSNQMAAERLVREWQSLLMSFAFFDIDFDTVRVEFQAETEEEKSEISMPSFTLSHAERYVPLTQFEHAARAFLASEHASAHLEAVAHYRDGRIAQQAGRFIDAYNGFFLFLETRYCAGKTQKREQLKLLLATSGVKKSVEQMSDELRMEFAVKQTALSSVATEPTDVSEILAEIIALRGLLRHHNLNSPKRWDPNNTERYELEVRFLGAICGSILLEELFMRTYDKEILDAFNQQANDLEIKTRLRVRVKRIDSQESNIFDITCPVPNVSTLMAFSSACLMMKNFISDGSASSVEYIEANSVNRRVNVFEINVFQIPKSIEQPGAPLPFRAIIEYKREGIARSGQFEIPCLSDYVDRSGIWRAGLQAMEHFDHRTPDAELFSIRLVVGDDCSVFCYRLGATIGR